MTGYVIMEYHPKTGLQATAVTSFEVESFDDLREEAALLRADFEEYGYVIDRLFIAEAV